MTRTHHVIFSGGLDYTALLGAVIDAYGTHDVRAVSFDYGQRHTIELSKAVRIASHYGVAHHIIDVPNLLSSEALLASSTKPVPEGDYEPETMKDTVVQGRNLLFASLTIAQAQPGDVIWLGVHSGDHALYGDCKPEFWAHIIRAAQLGYKVHIETPYLNLTKAEIVANGDAIQAPFHLSYSCYQGGEKHCGQCATCLERRQAFTQAGIVDPTAYERNSTT